MNRSCRSSKALAALPLALLTAACGGAFVESADGTGSSMAAASNRPPLACPALACDLDCSSTGYALDAIGCPVCACAGAVPCSCEDGTSCADDGSCPGSGACLGAEACPDGTPCVDGRCASPDVCPPLCDRFCPYGNVIDRNGCELCECNEGPRTCNADADCAEGERCTPDASARAQRVCELVPACECPAQELPVCGTDGQNYPSPCGARCAGVEVAHEGSCQGLCPALDCRPCENGFVIGADGCGSCECAPSNGCADATDPACACAAGDTACNGGTATCASDADCAEGELCALDSAGGADVAGHCEAAAQCRTARDCEAGPQPVPACPIEWSCEQGACIFRCAS